MTVLPRERMLDERVIAAAGGGQLLEVAVGGARVRSAEQRPLLVSGTPGSSRKLDGLPNVPGSTSVYGYCALA